MKTMYKNLLAVSLVFVLLAVNAATISAGRQSASASGENAVQLPVNTVTIEKKTLEAVITNIGDRYKVVDETIIVGLDGQQVNIRKMLVPCDAEVTYTTEQGARIAQRIKMIRIGNNPSWHWIAERPE